MKNLQKQEITLTSEFVEECQAIIVEAVFASRWALVEGYWHLGKRIREEAEGFSITDFTASLAVALGKSERLIWYAVKLYDKYPVLDSIPEGKNISWNKLVTKYLPETAEVEGKGEAKAEKIFCWICRYCGGANEVTKKELT